MLQRLEAVAEGKALIKVRNLTVTIQSGRAEATLGLDSEFVAAILATHKGEVRIEKSGHPRLAALDRCRPAGRPPAARAVECR